jgi:hypothetical protein
MNTDTTTQAIIRIERSQHLFRLALGGAVVLEGLLIGTMLLLVNFADRTQALIFVGTIGGYTLVALGFVMLATYVDRAVLRVAQLTQYR